MFGSQVRAFSTSCVPSTHCALVETIPCPLIMSVPTRINGALLIYHTVTVGMTVAIARFFLVAAHRILTGHFLPASNKQRPQAPEDMVRPRLKSPRPDHIPGARRLPPRTRYDIHTYCGPCRKTILPIWYIGDWDSAATRVCHCRS